MRRNFIIGIDLGGTNLKIALLDEKYRLRDKKILNTQGFLKKESLISAIADSINKIIKKNQLKKAEVQGVGLGLPGPVDNARGIVHFFPNIPGWKEVPLKRILERKIKLPVFLDNDAKLMCLAEYNLGAAKGFKNAICLTLGTGVGGGIIINGRLYRGSNNASAEIGHIPLNQDGPACNCGGRACLEAYVGNNRILKQSKRIFKRDVTLEELSLLAQRQNKKARIIWMDAAKKLGIALSGAVNLLNPDCIVIGGGVAEAGRILFDNIRKTIKERAMNVQARHVKIFKARLGNEAGMIGAAILVRESTKAR